MRRPLLFAVPLVTAFVLISSSACGRKAAGIQAGPDFQRDVLDALLEAKPGSVVELGAGKHDLDQTLSVNAANITIRGQGAKKTILSFAGQKGTAEGLVASGDGFTLEDLAILDTKGNAVRVNGTDRVTIRRVRTEWTEAAKENHGPYGIYLVQCKNVLIEDSEASGASAAGIYVGESSNIVVRRNRVTQNTAGIGMENSEYADVYENSAKYNSGGILVVNLPDLPVKNGRHVRVFNNEVVANNTENFAPKEDFVSKVSPGTGLMLVAASQVDVYNNTIMENETTNISIVSYLTIGNAVADSQYDPYAEALYVHDNAVSNGGNAPNGEQFKRLKASVGAQWPDILYDGAVNRKKLTVDKRLPGDLRICIQNNGPATFFNIVAAREGKNAARDLGAYHCSFAPLSPVALP